MKYIVSLLVAMAGMAFAQTDAPTPAPPICLQTQRIMCVGSSPTVEVYADTGNFTPGRAGLPMFIVSDQPSMLQLCQSIVATLKATAPPGGVFNGLWCEFESDGTARVAISWIAKASAPVPLPYRGYGPLMLPANFTPATSTAWYKTVNAIAPTVITPNAASAATIRNKFVNLLTIWNVTAPATGYALHTVTFQMQPSGEQATDVEWSSAP